MEWIIENRILSFAENALYIMTKLRFDFKYLLST